MATGRDRHLKRNRAQCAKCGDIIESMSQHDFKWCKCKAIFVDGGRAYSRFGYNEKEDFIDLCEFEEEDGE